MSKPIRLLLAGLLLFLIAGVVTGISLRLQRGLSTLSTLVVIAAAILGAAAFISGLKDAYDLLWGESRAKRPNLPGGVLGVPSLPPHWQERPADMTALKSKLLSGKGKRVAITAQVTSSRQGSRVGVHGMPGIGKSVLAMLLAHDRQIQRAFRDGVYWVKVGREAKPVEAQLTLWRMLGAQGETFITGGEGKALLGRLLVGKKCLLILDDIWEANQVEAFDILDQSSGLVITTRDSRLITALGAEEQAVDLLDERQAMRLLADWSGQNVSTLPDAAYQVAKKCERLPLALALSGARVKSGVSWSDVLAALEESKLAYLDHPHGSALSSIAASVTALPEGEARLYRLLTAIAEDAIVPEKALLRVWSLVGKIPEHEARLHLTSLAQKALLWLDGETPGERVIGLHDLLHLYLQGEAKDVKAVHRDWLDAYWKIFQAQRPKGTSWADGPDDGYYFQYLPHHLIKAGQANKLRRLLLDFAWLQAKLEATDVTTLITDYDQLHLADSDHSLRLVQGAIRLSAHILADDKHQLAGQLLGRLLAKENSEIQMILSQAQAWHGVDWLRPVTACLTAPGGPLICTLAGHRGPVTGVAITADGRFALSACADGTVKVWDIQSGQERNTLVGHTKGVTGVAVTTDGRLALSASDDGTVKVWDIQSGQERDTLIGHRGPVYGIAVTTDSQFALSASGDDTVKVWNLQSGQERYTLRGHSKPVTGVAVTSDGRFALSASGDQTVKVWNLQSGLEQYTLKGHKRWVTGVAVTADGRFALSASWDGTVKVWDIQNGQELTTLVERDGWATGVAVTADGRLALSASWGGTVKVWDIQNGQELSTLAEHSGMVKGGEVTAENKFALHAPGDGTVKIFRIIRFRQRQNLARDGVLVTGIAVTPDGRFALSASDDRKVKVWDIQSSQERRTLAGHRGPVTGVAVTGDGRFALSASADGTVKVWDIQSGQEQCTLIGHTKEVTGVAVTGDGRFALSASGDRTVKVWDIQSGQERDTLIGHREPVYGVAVTGDGRFALSASGDRTVKVWDLQIGYERRSLAGHKKPVTGVAVTADGRLALSASDDHTVKVWNLQSGQEQCTLKGHSEPVTGVAVTADGRFALSASWDGTVKVWDIQNGQESYTLRGHTDIVSGVVVTADGRLALSTSRDRTVKFWRVSTGRVLATFTADASLSACAITADGSAMIAGDELGQIHFLRLERVSQDQSEDGSITASGR